jgi:trk system potassium uptake protein
MARRPQGVEGIGGAEALLGGDTRLRRHHVAHRFQPVGDIIGRLSVVFGASMLLPALLDYSDGHENWYGTLIAAFLTVAAGAALAQANTGARHGLSRQQAFLLTVLIWVVGPTFGALPFVFAAPGASFTDAFFEAISGLTTTGASVFTDLEEAPRGMLLWRAMMQWYGGLGIVIVAMVFLPAMKIGGMQFFQSEAFDVSGDILPRASEVARQLIWIYLALTLGCFVGYAAVGMTSFEALCQTLTTVSTGGYGTRDTSFAEFPPAAQWIGIVFMSLAAWPFVRFIQLGRGNARGLLRDSQIRAFMVIVLAVSGAIAAWLVVYGAFEPMQAAREAMFNVTSLITGTGFATGDYNAWGAFPVSLFLILPMIGGCAGSTSCSAKVFRYQILLETLRGQIGRMRSPHGVFTLRYQGRPVEPDVVSSIMAFFFVFLCSLGIWAILLSMTGLDFVTALSGSIAALCNVGPGLGPIIGPVGSYQSLSDEAKWLLSAGMLLGRLEFLSVLVLLTPVFWRR